MTTQIKAFNTQHLTLVHSVQLSPLKNYLATSSADGRINIFNSNDLTLHTTAIMHEGSILKLCWAPPQFGAFLCSAGYDGKVCVIQIVQRQMIVKYQTRFDSPVYSIDWCPIVINLVLLAATQKGDVTQISLNNSIWQSKQLLSKTQTNYPTFISIGKSDSSNVLLIAHAQNKILSVYEYQLQSSLIVLRKRIQLYSSVFDLSWQHALFSDQILIIMTKDQLLFYDSYLQKCYDISTNETGNDSNLSVGWSQDNSLLNLYSITRNEYIVRSYCCNASGKFSLYK